MKELNQTMLLKFGGGFLFNDDTTEANDQGNKHNNLKRNEFANFITTSYDLDTSNDVEEDGDEYTFDPIITTNAGDLSFNVNEGIPKYCSY